MKTKHKSHCNLSWKGRHKHKLLYWRFVIAFVRYWRRISRLLFQNSPPFPAKITVLALKLWVLFSPLPYLQPFPFIMATLRTLGMATSFPQSSCCGRRPNWQRLDLRPHPSVCEKRLRSVLCDQWKRRNWRAHRRQPRYSHPLRNRSRRSHRLGVALESNPGNVVLLLLLWSNHSQPIHPTICNNPSRKFLLLLKKA